MIIIRLAGGLGNQIFQIGGGLLLAKKSNAKKIILDDSALNNYSASRTNELLSFFDFTKIDIEIEFKHLWVTKLRLPKVLSLKFSKYILVSDNNFKTIIQNPNKKFLILDGYFQWVLSQEVFDEVSQILGKIYRNKISDNIQNNSCVVHIRGGDFVKLGWNKITPPEYYLNALKFMAEKHEINNFIIVTDDKKYAKSILVGIDYKYEFRCSNMKDDFYTIANHSKRILSSSTFAQWASTLGNNENGIVIAPKFWFPDQERDIYLKNEMRDNYE